MKSLKEARKVKEGFFSAVEPDVVDRDNKEQAVQALLGSEDIDVKKVPDEKLSDLIQGLGSITTESIDSQVAQIISVMREQKASRNDVLEALQVHVGFNLREAKEVLQEYLQESSSPNKTGVRYGVFSRGGSVGSKHNDPVATFDNVEDAKQYAARRRKMLTPGERKYYKMGYVVRALKEAAKIKPEDFGIDKYDFDSNGFLNVHQSVNLASSKLTSLPFKFGKVSGDFNCFDNNLASLEGAPREVGGDFNCSYNELASLEGAPFKVGGSFYCYDNNLHSLEGAPREVGGDFGCAFNLTRFTIEDVKKVSKVGGPIHESGLPKLRGKTMESLKEANNIRSDLDTIVSKIEWWGYKYTADESDKGVSFSFSTATEANNVYKDLKRSRLFKDHWRLDIQGNELFYSIY